MHGQAERTPRASRTPTRPGILRFQSLPALHPHLSPSQSDHQRSGVHDSGVAASTWRGDAKCLEVGGQPQLPLCPRLPRQACKPRGAIGRIRHDAGTAPTAVTSCLMLLETSCRHRAAVHSKPPSSKGKGEEWSVREGGTQGKVPQWGLSVNVSPGVTRLAHTLALVGFFQTAREQPLDSGSSSRTPTRAIILRAKEVQRCFLCRYMQIKMQMSASSHILSRP